MSYRPTDILTEKLNTTVNYSENQSYDTEHILKNLDRFVVEQQEILEDCSTLLFSKIQFDPLTCFSEFSSKNAAANLFNVLHNVYGVTRLFSSSVPDLTVERPVILNNLSSTFYAEGLSFISTPCLPASLVCEKGSLSATSCKVSSIVHCNQDLPKSYGTKWNYLAPGAGHKNQTSKSVMNQRFRRQNIIMKIEEHWKKRSYQTVAESVTCCNLWVSYKGCSPGIKVLKEFINI